MLAFIVLLAMMPTTDLADTEHTLAPTVSAPAVVTSLGVGLWLSALNVEYRDVRYVVPFLTHSGCWRHRSLIQQPAHEPWRTIYG